jgi:hypothetical protein
MDLRLVVLPIHEDSKEAFCGLETENGAKISLLVVNVTIGLVDINAMNFIEGIKDLRKSNAQVPDHLWSAHLVVMKLCDNHSNDLLYRGPDFSRCDDLLISLIE